MRVWHHKTGFTKNVKQTSLNEKKKKKKKKKKTRNMKIMKGKTTTKISCKKHTCGG